VVLVLVESVRVAVPYGVSRLRVVVCVVSVDSGFAGSAGALGAGWTIVVEVLGAGACTIVSLVSFWTIGCSFTTVVEEVGVEGWQPARTAAAAIVARAGMAYLMAVSPMDGLE
jgi:hypothetical protein